MDDWISSPLASATPVARTVEGGDRDDLGSGPDLAAGRAHRSRERLRERTRATPGVDRLARSAAIVARAVDEQDGRGAAPTMGRGTRGGRRARRSPPAGRRSRTTRRRSRRRPSAARAGSSGRRAGRARGTCARASGRRARRRARAIRCPAAPGRRARRGTARGNGRADRSPTYASASADDVDRRASAVRAGVA